MLATAEDSESDYWDAFTFQVDWSRGKPTLEKDEKYYLSECLAPSQVVYKLPTIHTEFNDKNLEDGHEDRDNLMTMNCTVIYLDQCVSLNKCRQSCQTTGASSYRYVPVK